MKNALNQRISSCCDRSLLTYLRTMTRRCIRNVLDNSPGILHYCCLSIVFLTPRFVIACIIYLFWQGRADCDGDTTAAVEALTRATVNFTGKGSLQRVYLATLVPEVFDKTCTSLNVESNRFRESDSELTKSCSLSSICCFNSKRSELHKRISVVVTDQPIRRIGEVNRFGDVGGNLARKQSSSSLQSSSENGTIQSASDYDISANGIEVQCIETEVEINTAERQTVSKDWQTHSTVSELHRPLLAGNFDDAGQARGNDTDAECDSTSVDRVGNSVAGDGYNDTYAECDSTSVDRVGNSVAGDGYKDTDQLLFQAHECRESHDTKKFRAESNSNISSKSKCQAEINNVTTKTESLSTQEEGINRSHSPHHPVKGTTNQNVDPEMTKGLILHSSRQCAICLCRITDAKQLDKCGHVFCSECIDVSFKTCKPICPTCLTVYGEITGNQPEGTMDLEFREQSLPGYEDCGTIGIVYNFPNGIQGASHPNPGVPYTGTSRTGYLPDNREGREVIRLLKTAFDRKLTFTIGRSTTSGADNVVTWNDIHHKTSISGGPERFGYPDHGYLMRVKEELANQGVVVQPKQ